MLNLHIFCLSVYKQGKIISWNKTKSCTCIIFLLIMLHVKHYNIYLQCEIHTVKMKVRKLNSEEKCTWKKLNTILFLLHICILSKMAKRQNWVPKIFEIKILQHIYMNIRNHTNIYMNHFYIFLFTFS